MICRYCGKEIPDNSEYCEFCNESLIDKIVLDDKALLRAKENRRKEESPIFIRAYYKAKESAEEKRLRQERELQEAANGGKKAAKVYTGDPFYKMKKARVIAVILSLLPALTAILSIFLNWQYYVIKSGKDVKQSNSLKSIVQTSLTQKAYTQYAKNMKFANYVPLICMIMLIIASIYILYLAVIDLYPEKKIPKDPLLKRFGFIARLVPVVLIVLATIIFVRCKMYQNALNGMKDFHTGYSSLIGYDESKSVSSGKGFGYVLAILTPIIYVGSKIYVFVINTLNEED
ncbi:MAG: zinc ribbon domain-containing protein [Eubacterium sp.]|nr:zinc ribbon domain-containing protein [Eubacterium sp.]